MIRTLHCVCVCVCVRVYVCVHVCMHVLCSTVLHRERGALSWAISQLSQIPLLLRNTSLSCSRLLFLRFEILCIETRGMRLIVILHSLCYQCVPLLLMYSVSGTLCADEHSTFLCHKFTDCFYL